MRRTTGIELESYSSNNKFKVISKLTIDVNLMVCIKDKFVVVRIGFDRSMARVSFTPTYMNTHKWNFSSVLLSSW
jgi:hypothetical protein